jgi:hypothetical protein
MSPKFPPYLLRRSALAWPALADELRTHLQRRQTGFLFESNRDTRYSTRVYAETSLRAFGDNYIRALGGKQ